MPFHRFLSFRPLWGKSSTPQMRSRAWMPHTENWIVSAAYFPAIQHYWRHSICQPLKPRKMDHADTELGTGLWWTGHHVRRVGCPNKVHMNYWQSRRNSSPALDMPEAHQRAFRPIIIIDDLYLQTFCSHTQIWCIYYSYIRNFLFIGTNMHICCY